MKKTFRLIMCAAVSCAVSLSFYSCSDDDEDNSLVVSNNIPAEAEEEATIVADDITMDDESLKYVGYWSGKGPSEDSENYTVESGTWRFFNDGTYEWYIADEDGNDQRVMTGNWTYSNETIELDSKSGWKWTEVAFIEGRGWTGKGPDPETGELKTYNNAKKTGYTVKPSVLKILNYHSGGFSIVDTIKNYKLCDGKITYGVRYAKSDADITDDAAWTEYPVSGIFKKNSTRGIFNVELSGLTDDTKYYLQGYMKYADGTIVAGETYRAIPVTPPANTVCMGDTTFWYTSCLDQLYTAEEAAAALEAIGGALPSVAETNHLVANSTLALENGRIVLTSRLTGGVLSFATELHSNTYMTYDYWRADGNSFYLYRSLVAGGMGQTPEYQSKAALFPVIKKAVTWEADAE